MAIKTQLVEGQPRIITKVVNGQRRVSCSCCPSDDEGCCMYPADQLGVGYTLDDLPDQIEVREPTILGPDPVIFNKNGAEYEHFSQSSTEKVFVDIDGIGRPIWKFQSVSEEILERPLSFNAPFCLITEIEDVGFEGAGDLFADTYKIEFNNVSDPASSEENGSAAFVVRRSLCVWSEDFEEDEPSGVKLLYRDFRNNRPRWQIQYSDDRAMGKAGPTGQLDGLLNTPEGSYGSSGGESAIISEA
jgi:hypothetical protein